MEVFAANADREKQLVDALKQGKQSAFEDLYDHYAPSFYGEIKRNFYKEDVSAQTLQQVFQNIGVSISSYDPSRERLFTWGIRIVRKEIRKQKTELVLKELFYCRQSNPVVAGKTG